MATVNEKLTAIADAIRANTGGTEKLSLDGIADAIPEVYEQGKQAQYDEFWDAVQTRGKARDYSFRFAGYGWNDDTFKPKYDLIMTRASNTFAFCKIKDLRGILEKQGVVLDTSGCSNFSSMFESASITRIPTLDLRLQDRGYSIFFDCQSLTSIQKLIFKDDGSTPIKYNMFQNCDVLREIEIEGVIGNNINLQWAHWLYKSSIINIVEHLSDTATGKIITFSRYAINGAFGINVNDETTFPEGSEYYNLRHSKDNWTFNFM